jgi:hypothetical protein
MEKEGKREMWRGDSSRKRKRKLGLGHMQL